MLACSCISGSAETGASAWRLKPYVASTAKSRAREGVVANGRQWRGSGMGAEVMAATASRRAGAWINAHHGSMEGDGITQ